jgi:hypothetical protein
MPGHFGRTAAANAGLSVPLQLIKRRVDRSSVGLAHTTVTPTNAVSDIDFGAENVTSQPARCSMAMPSMCRWKRS